MNCLGVLQVACARECTQANGTHETHHRCASMLGERALPESRTRLCAFTHKHVCAFMLARECTRVAGHELVGTLDRCAHDSSKPHQGGEGCARVHVGLSACGTRAGALANCALLAHVSFLFVGKRSSRVFARANLKQLLWASVACAWARANLNARECECAQAFAHTRRTCARLVMNAHGFRAT